MKFTIMRNIRNILLIAVFVISVNQIYAQSGIYIKYDEAYMDKYQYKVENLSAHNFHNAFHIYTSNTERIILNMAMSSYQQLGNNKVQSIDEIDWSAALINEINNNLTTVYLVFNEDDIYQTYQVNNAIFVEESDHKLMYSSPYYSFTFDKNKKYGVAEDLEPGTYDISDETIFMTGNGNSTTNCLNHYSFIKILKETHPKGSFTMISNSDFTSLHKDEILETCQSALYVDFAENIGIIEERTKNGKITLIGINEEPIAKYIAEKCQVPLEYNIITPSKAASINPTMNNILDKPELNSTTENDRNTEKSGIITTNRNISSTASITISDNTTTANTIDAEYELVYEMLSSHKVTPQNAEKSVSTILKNDTKQHIVDNGETLYSISKEYGVTIKQLQEINNLETPSIFVTQVLIIKE
jgi:LysM repeat protein